MTCRRPAAADVWSPVSDYPFQCAEPELRYCVLRRHDGVVSSAVGGRTPTARWSDGGKWPSGRGVRRVFISDRPGDAGNRRVKRPGLSCRHRRWCLVSAVLTSAYFPFMATMFSPSPLLIRGGTMPCHVRFGLHLLLPMHGRKRVGRRRHVLPRWVCTGALGVGGRSFWCGVWCVARVRHGLAECGCGTQHCPLDAVHDYLRPHVRLDWTSPKR